MSQRLVFGMRMSNTPPGKSKSKYEHINNPESKEWQTLAAIANWRQVLSSLFIQPMEIDRKTFRSVEHYLQYRKAALADEKQAFNLFVTESGSEVALGSGFDARKARKTIRLSEVQWQEWKERVEKEAKSLARQAKFAPGTTAHRVLLATGTAELWSTVPRMASVRMFHHEELRETLRKGTMPHLQITIIG